MISPIFAGKLIIEIRIIPGVFLLPVALYYFFHRQVLKDVYIMNYCNGTLLAVVEFSNFIFTFSNIFRRQSIIMEVLSIRDIIFFV